MTIDNVSADVRIVTYSSVNALELPSFDDVVVEERYDGMWQRYWGANSISNDYAYSEAKRIARALAERRLSSNFKG